METKQHLFLNSRDELYRVEAASIVYFEADGNYTKFVTRARQQGILSMNLSRMTAVLSQHLGEAAATFARVGKRHIVNLAYVFHVAITRQRLVLSDGQTFAYELTVSREALRSLRQLYMDSLAPRAAHSPQPSQP